ncbi:hypothetical protein ACFWIJ_38140 [Streptomyces sp. NPDC127079]|uniref:hypothetical protein n=1 Tax=Streptomyces sp. NPDC127079 TaxID=3347132 RepID=UPI003668B25C
MAAGWCTRSVRAALFAAVCVLLSALAHTMMSGTPVPWWALGAGSLGAGGVGWALAGRERGLRVIVPVVIAAQGALHWSFSVAQGAGAGQPAAPPGGNGTGALGMGSTGMGSADMGSVGTGSMGMGSVGTGSMGMGSVGTGSMGMGSVGGHSVGMGMHSMGMDPSVHPGGTSMTGMYAAHLVAALVCGLWLGYGERVAFRLMRAVAGWLAAPLRLVLALPALPRRPRALLRRRRTRRGPRRLHLVHAITSRGPPLSFAVV